MARAMLLGGRYAKYLASLPGAGFDIRQLLAGALEVNMTVNKLKVPIIEAEELASKRRLIPFIKKLSTKLFLRRSTFVRQMTCMIFSLLKNY